MKMFGGAQKDTKAPSPSLRMQAKFFEDMAAKQQAQVAAPSAAPMPTQREQAMKMFGGAQKHEGTRPRRSECKGQVLEDMAQSSRRKSPRRLPRPCQRNASKR